MKQLYDAPARTEAPSLTKLILGASGLPRLGSFFSFLTAHSSLASSRLRWNSFYSSENNTRDALQPTPLPTIHRKVRLNDQKSQAERHLKPLRWCGRPRISCHIFEGNASSHRLCGSLTYTTRRPMNKARYVLAKHTWFAERNAKKKMKVCLRCCRPTDICLPLSSSRKNNFFCRCNIVTEVTGSDS